MRILVAEDEPAIADFIERGLTAEGYAVTVATGGAEALRRALAEDYALMILDRMLPECDGLDVLTKLRPVKPSLPVIMLTARTEIDDRVAGLDAGAVDYITKPFAFDELAARVILDGAACAAGSSRRPRRCWSQDRASSPRRR